MILVPEYFYKFLLLLLIFARTQCDSQNEEVVKKLDAMITGVKTQIYSRATDDGLKIWEEYEFGTGVGNREELIVTNIHIEDEKPLSINEVKNWQFSDGLHYAILAGSAESNLWVYFYSKEDSGARDKVFLTANGTIFTFKVMNSFNSSTNHEDIVIVLCVESESEIKLNWYKIVSDYFELISSSIVSKRVERLDFFQHNGRNKLLLVNEPVNHDGAEYSSIEIYGFSLVAGLLDFWFCQKIRVPRVSGLQLCSIYENTYLTIQSQNQVSLYEFKESETKEGLFEPSQNITCNGLKNSICFDNGYTEYLILSGPEPALFTFLENEFINDSKIAGKLLADLGEILWVECLPVKTYREECLLLIQLKNSTLVGLTWQGQAFAITSLPQFNIDDFRLSEITVIPKYGFIYKNDMIKVETKLQDLPRPFYDQMEKMLLLKNSLEETFLKQEMILDETERKIRDSYYSNSIVTGIWNLSEVHTKSVKISRDVSYNSLVVGSKLLTAVDMATDLTVIDVQLRNLDKKMEKIRLISNAALPANSPEVHSNGFSFYGGMNVLGTLHVQKLTFESLNGYFLEDIINDFVRYGKDGVIKGRKSFPSIEAENINIVKINGVPVKDIIFDTEPKNYEDINFSALDELVVNGSLNFSNVNGFSWDSLMKNVVWKDQDAVIPGLTVVLGDIVADNLMAETLNGLDYPGGYILQNSTDPAEILGEKTFADIKVGNLKGIKTINGIPYEDFLTLNNEQTLPNEITFENLIIDESLQIDGTITGIHIDQEEHRRTLIDSNVITADTTFRNLHVTGNIIVENSVNGMNSSDFDDIVRKSEENAVIYGQKHFLGNAQIKNKLIVTSKQFNGHAIDEFVTLTGEQTFANLKRISTPVTFDQLEYKQLTELQKHLVDFVEGNKNLINSSCWSKKLIFNVSPVFEDIAFGTLNNNISVSNFSENYRRTFQNVNFENLEVKRLHAGVIKPTIINDVIFSDFEDRRISFSYPQILSGNYTIKYLKAGELKTQSINGMSLGELETFREDFEDLFDQIWNGRMTIETFIVKGQVQTNTINGESLANIYANNELRNVIVSDGFYVRDLRVDGLVNGINLTDYVLDSVFKSYENVLLTGEKIVDNINCRILEFPILNGSPVGEILNSKLLQTLSGPVLVNGNVIVMDSFGCNGKVNDVVYSQLIDRITNSKNNTFKLHGDFQFFDDITIENLHIDGTVQGIAFDKFLDSVVFQGDDVDITGTKIFTNPVTFNRNFTIDNEYNGLDLTAFNQHAVFIDRDIHIDSEIIFTEDLNIAGDLIVEEYLYSKTISDVDIEQLKSSVIFLDKPSYVQGTLTFTNATFESNLTIQRLNDVDLNAVIPLTEEQAIFNRLLFVNVSVESLRINGTVNDLEIGEIFGNTFMLNGNQTITGNLLFHGNVQMQNNFDSKFINTIDTSKMISLDGDQEITGIFEFTKPLILRKNLEVDGLVNDIDLSLWESEAVYDTFPTKQLTSGNWYINGNVTFERDFLGTGLLGGIDVQRLYDKLEKRNLMMDSTLSSVKKDLESTCQDLTPLQKYATNQIHKFKFFEYFQIINFDVNIKSVHHFEWNGAEFLLINLQQCFLNIFFYNGTGFTIVATQRDFDSVEKWITLTYDNQVYFLTVGNGMCGKSYGNLWNFEGEKLRHLLDLGSVSDVKKIGDYNFLVISGEKLEKWSIRDVHSGIYGSLIAHFSTKENSRFVPNTQRILLVENQFIHEFDLENFNRTSLSNHFGNGAIISLQAGIFQTEMFLYYDEGVSENNAFLFNGLSDRKIRQSISTHKPNSFLVINFDGFIETFLTFVKNGRSLEIFEYRGIEGFVYRESIKMQIAKTFAFKLRKHSGLSKLNYVAAIHGNTLTIMEAKMYGEKLDVELLTCEEH